MWSLFANRITYSGSGAYGGVASFSIGFRSFSANDLTCSISRNTLIARVEYDAAKQKSCLSEALSSVHEFLENKELQDLPTKVRVGHARVMLYLYVVKSGVFSEARSLEGEQEWRLVVLPPWDRAPGAYAGLPVVLYNQPASGGYLPDVREHRGTLLPYAVIKPTTGKFDIQSITVGPF